MTTPITQEEKQPLSPEETLRLLREVLAEKRTVLAIACESELNVTAVRAGAKAAALEQSIAILSMLNHPGFRKAEHIVAGGDMGGYCFAVLPEGDSGIFRQVGHHAATVMDAILKVHAAHAALKPQEGATSGKEPADADA